MGRHGPDGSMNPHVIQRSSCCSPPLSAYKACTLRAAPGAYVMPLTIATLAEQPRWDLDRTLALPGWCRGGALGRWGVGLTRRFGGGALARLRGRLPAEHARIAPGLTARDTVPAHAQLVLTEAIVDEFLGGDLGALAPLLIEDTRASIGRIQRAVVKTMGAHRALAHGARGFRDVYDRGSAAADTATGRSRVTFRGHELYAHPP